MRGSPAQSDAVDRAARLAVVFSSLPERANVLPWQQQPIWAAGASGQHEPFTEKIRLRDVSHHTHTTKALARLRCLNPLTPPLK